MIHFHYSTSNLPMLADHSLLRPSSYFTNRSYILSYKPNFIAATKSDLIQFTSITETRLEKATSGSGNDLVMESESLRLLGRLLEFHLHAHGQKPTRTLTILSTQRPGYAP